MQYFGKIICYFKNVVYICINKQGQQIKSLYIMKQNEIDNLITWAENNAKCRTYAESIVKAEREYHKIMKYDFHYIRKAKNMETISKILQKFFSRADLKDITYEVTEISSGSLKYQLDFNANWK